MRVSGSITALPLPVNVLIADDHQLITDGLSKMLETEKIIGEIHIAGNGREAVDKVLVHAIDCVIMDINMPVLNTCKGAGGVPFMFLIFVLQ